jgi:exosortase F-associated protein
VLIGLLGLLGLVAAYLFQYTDILSVFALSSSAEARFIANRFVRIIINDSSMMAILYALFYDRGVLKLAFYIQLIDLFLLFPIYLAFKLPAEGASELSSPFLSQFHRLIVNPTLMILLIPALIFQRTKSLI